MKIEKISDTQIRCTLNRADLVSREIKISELAYGTEKAKTLFHDMIEQASTQFGFEADDIPLMIEAIPVSSDCIVLIITKVDDPEELDTRFSKFTPSSEDIDVSSDDGAPFLDMLEDIVDSSGTSEPNVLDAPIEPKESEGEDKKDTFIPITESLSKKTEVSEDKDAKEPKEPVEVTKMFSFVTWNEASEAASSVIKEFDGSSSFYEDHNKKLYYLLIKGLTDGSNGFFMICNRLSEYGKREKFVYSTLGYLSEHCELIIKDKAIKILSEF